MIYCQRCDRSFYDGEVITIRSVAGTEEAYHHGCFVEWTDEQREVAKSFGPTFDQSPELPVEFFSRTFRDSQFKL
jgi:hypothetical protein